MKILLIAVAILTQSVPAFAGGLDCQIKGICQCLANGTCDKDGYPIEKQKPVKQEEVIVCGSGKQAARVVLGQPFSQMPREGTVPAKFYNIPLIVSDSAQVSTTPVFNTRLVQFITAYCQYSIEVDVAGRDKYFVRNAALECEGQTQPLQCEVL